MKESHTRKVFIRVEHALFHVLSETGSHRVGKRVLVRFVYTGISLFNRLTLHPFCLMFIDQICHLPCVLDLLCLCFSFDLGKAFFCLSVKGFVLG
jgi:hypothetical protein